MCGWKYGALFEPELINGETFKKDALEMLSSCRPVSMLSPQSNELH